MAQWVRSDINIDFVSRRRHFYIGSSVTIGAVFLLMVVNAFVRGQPLNFGTDFKGGTQVQVQFKRPVKPGDVRAALEKAGFGAAEVVRLEDPVRPNMFMLRMGEVSSFSEGERKKVRDQIEQLLGQGSLVNFDYRAGSDKVYVKLGKKVDVAAKEREDEVLGKLRQAFQSAGVDLQQARLFGRAEDRSFEVTLGALAADLERAFEARLGKGVVEDIPQVETVGAKMGKQLRDDGIKALIYSMALILVYIALRFDFRYAPGAVVAMAHDVIVTVGVFAVTWQEFSMPTIAALLTVAGYSVNDTIVIYDRIRENVARLRDRKFSLIVNTSINETLGRTLLTSLTVLFTCVAIWFMGTDVIRGFATALIAGVVAGTYSTVFIASPLVIALNQRFSSAARGA